MRWVNLWFKEKIKQFTKWKNSRSNPFAVWVDDYDDSNSDDF